MPLLIPEIAEKLKDWDEITLLEILNITAEELVERFYDKIEDKYETLRKDFDEEDMENE